jgi:flagellar M-ring protein FliF
MEAIKTLLAQVQKFWAGKDVRFKRIVIIVAAIVLVAIILSSVLLNQVNYATLYTGLDSTDSAAVLAALKTQKITPKVVGDSILVPADQADSLRMSLSSEIKSGMNLDILKQGQGLGVTESQSQDYRKYQIQQDTQNALKQFDGVKDAKVAITMATDSVTVITDNQQVSTAGVILTLDDGVELTSSQVKAIADFVKNSVPRLTLDNISIMDSNMQSLDVTGSDDLGSTTDQYALQSSVEAKLRKQVMALLMPIFGIGKVESQVNVTLDFDDQTTDSVTYKPVVNDKDGVIVSYDKLKEQIVNGDTSATGAVGTSTNTGTSTTTYPTVTGNNGTYEKTEDKVNYEVNSINDHLKKAKGSIKSLSVSVILDNTNSKQDLTDNVKSLVMNAVGAVKGNVTVEYMPMTGTKSLTDTLAKDSQNAATNLKNQQTRFYIAIGAVVLVLVVAMMLLFMNKKAKYKAEVQKQVAAAMAENAPPAEEAEADMESEDNSSDIHIVQESGTKGQIGKLIEQNPELVANLLRSWLADEQE